MAAPQRMNGTTPNAPMEDDLLDDEDTLVFERVASPRSGPRPTAEVWIKVPRSSLGSLGLRVTAPAPQITWRPEE
jgi:hypothetical protein